MRPLALVLALLVAAALVWGGWETWELVQRLEQEVESLDGQVTDLQDDLDLERQRADVAEEAATEAEEKAAQADRVATFMEERAVTAESDAAVASESAAAERTRAESAQAEARQAVAARDQAEQKRIEAEQKASDAELEAWRARREAERLEKERSRNLDRLESALGRLAETRRTALGVVMNLGDSIEFDFDRAELRPDARELLSRIAGVLLTAQEFGIQVYGHTDDVGTPEYNLELSERRAAAVRNYLIDAGIDSDQIVMKGFGMNAPLVEGTDDAARQRNRRVEIAVVQITESEVSGVPADSR